MGSSNLAVATLVAMFIVFVTTRGRLPSYFAVFTGNVSTSGVATVQSGLSTATGLLSGANSTITGANQLTNSVNSLGNTLGGGQDFSGGGDSISLGTLGDEQV